MRLSRIQEGKFNRFTNAYQNDYLIQRKVLVAHQFNCKNIELLARRFQMANRG